MTLTKGKLLLTKKRKPQVEYMSKKGKHITANLAEGELSQTIADRLQEMNGKEVEFELIGGQPKKVREVGGEFIPPSRNKVGNRDRGRHGSRRSGGVQSRGNVTSGAQKRRRPDFHNPYNSVPAPPRKTEHPELGDHAPIISQDRFHADRYTGRIRVRMRAVTPLIVIDPQTETVFENDHKTYDLLKDADGSPLIPASSIRGMLRSAYEAVTNSRFGRFDSRHKARLAYRMEAREALRLVPARIEDGKIHLLIGTSKVNGDGSPNGPQYAAWLPRYSGNDKNTNQARKYPDGSLPKHGDEVRCWVELVQHHGWNRRKRQHVGDFAYWRVIKIVRADEQLGEEPQPSPAPSRRDGKSWHEPKGDIKRIQGWVCITNANIARKHDERVFFLAKSNNPQVPFAITDEHKKKWKDLIRNYQQIHEEELAQRRRQNRHPDEYLGREPGKTAWSRHVYTKDDLDLKDGTLCYVRLNHNHTDVEALFPVMISRELYQCSPRDLLHESLRPAACILELSPADRVFGWVRTERKETSGSRNEPTAVRGLLRVGPVTCLTKREDAIEEFGEEGLPLAILAQPKPQQGRFYVARNAQGEAQGDGLDKGQAGYIPGKALRGRKIYPHHAGLPQGHWDNPMEDRTQQGNGPWQEYRRPMRDNNEQRDSQNRSVRGWIKPGTEFSFDIHVLNLSKMELGALLWLLSLPENHFFRFGGGKPLGFGSVRLFIEDIDVGDGTCIRQRYASWKPAKNEDDHAMLQEEAVAAFKAALVDAYPEGRNFEDIPFIKAFLRACRGFEDGRPVHYARATPDGRPGPPSPDGESFKWFVANEKRENRYALRNVWEDDGLPTLEVP